MQTIDFGSLKRQVSAVGFGGAGIVRTYGRDKASSLLDLQTTLQRLQTSYLNLWQIHDVRTEDGFHRIRKKGLAIVVMKVLSASHYILPKLNVSHDLLTRYALSFDITLRPSPCLLSRGSLGPEETTL